MYRKLARTLRALALAGFLLAASGCQPLPHLPDGAQAAVQLLTTIGQAQSPTAEAPPSPAAPASLPEKLVERGERLLSTLSIQPSSLGFTMSFHPEKPRHRGLTFADRNHIDIYVSESMSDSLLLHVIAHELGHAVDLTLVSHHDAAAWRIARDFDADEAWWPTSDGSDFATPAGDFAECFAAYLTGDGISFSRKGSCHGTEGVVKAIARQSVAQVSAE